MLTPRLCYSVAELLASPWPRYTSAVILMARSSVIRNVSTFGGWLIMKGQYDRETICIALPVIKKSFRFRSYMCILCGSL